VYRMAQIAGLSAFLLVVNSGAGVAQGLLTWMEDLFGGRSGYERRRELPEQWPPQERRERRDGGVRDGGARPAIAPVVPPIVSFSSDFAANSIVIDTGARKLYYVLADQNAYEYRIGVGREGFSWTGTEKISRQQAWPDWYPPAEMRERDPKLPEKMLGGVKNPLGAMALYLGDTLYRIHGTNDPKSIGRAESSGCFRMLNSAVLHLASIAQIGTPVTVVNSLPKQQEVSRAVEPPKESLSQPQEKPAPPAVVNDTPQLVSPAPDYRALRDYTLQAR
jgi:lipoprotein-anchoring transpeptidase ErfK/SrfK